MARLLLVPFAVFAFLVSRGQIVCDGNINESYWSMPLATSAGGPPACGGNNGRLNSLYAAATDSNIYIGIGGIVQSGHQIIVFIDSKTGGTNTGTFDKTSAPDGLQHLPAGTVFDAGFTADYCLIISNNAATTTTVQLFSTAATGMLTSIAAVVSGGSSTIAAGCNVGISPSGTDFTKGYEISLPRTFLNYAPLTQSNVQFMAMVIADDGNLGNQFLTHAEATATSCFGKGAGNNGVQFQTETAINPVLFNPSRSLPIDFINARGFQVGQAIKIFWTSATEKDMLEYQVERSDDALQYVRIGTVAARGNNTGQSSYDFADVQPLLGKSFYRIKAIDRNGRSTYSSIIKMQFGRVDNLLTIYPNPVVDQINLQMIGLKPDTYHLQVFNDLGQCLIDRTIVYSGGYGLQQIPVLPGMKKGPYRLLLRNKTQFYKQHFIVQ